MRNVYALTLGDLPDRLAIERLDLFAVEREFHRFGLAVARSHLVAFRRYQLPRGFGAAWPRPQIEASRMAVESSSRSFTSHGPLAISLAAFSVPARHGVHLPTLSSSKN